MAIFVSLIEFHRLPIGEKILSRCMCTPGLLSGNPGPDSRWLPIFQLKNGMTDRCWATLPLYRGAHWQLFPASTEEQPWLTCWIIVVSPTKSLSYLICNSCLFTQMSASIAISYAPYLHKWLNTGDLLRNISQTINRIFQTLHLQVLTLRPAPFQQQFRLNNLAWFTYISYIGCRLCEKVFSLATIRVN